MVSRLLRLLLVFVALLLVLNFAFAQDNPNVETFEVTGDATFPTLIVIAMRPATNFEATLSGQRNQVPSTKTAEAGDVIFFTLPSREQSYSIEVRDTATGSRPTVQSVVGSTCAARNVSNDGVNLRSAPTLGSSVVESLGFADTVPVYGRSESWFVVGTSTENLAWVFRGVILLVGQCGNVPNVTSSEEVVERLAAVREARNQAAAESTAEAQATSSPQNQAGNNQNQGANNQAAQATPVVSEFVPQAAKDDPYALSVRYDFVASVSDEVSSPNGDSADTINWAVTGWDQENAPEAANVLIVASCTGTRTNQVRFTVIVEGGENQTFNCGETLLQRVVNAEASSGRIRVQSRGNNAAYTQWTLTIISQPVQP